MLRDHKVKKIRDIRRICSDIQDIVFSHFVKFYTGSYNAKRVGTKIKGNQ